MKGFLCLVGLTTTTVFCAVIFDYIFFKVIEGVENLKYRYKKKHRYDKPPTAKCYCKDCIFHKNGVCSELIKAHTPDEFFCCAAERKENEK
nr:MAG TPA: hypothetical protein [Caudoviricetes sp.]